jgi:hypothetical protein
MHRKTSIAAAAAAFILVPWAALAHAPIRPIADANAKLTAAPVRLVAHRASHARPRVLRERRVSLSPSASDFPPISRVQPDNYKYWGEARSGGY